MIDFSIIIPFYNEEKNVELLYNEIISSVEGNYEIIMIDDGSTDNTWQEIKQIAYKDEKVKGIRFNRNYGQTNAIKAGIKNSSGKIIITMDGDLQNDPKDIPRLLKKLNEGYDVVSGWRKNRKDKYISRILPSRIANFIISMVTGVKLKDYGCTLKCYKKEYIEKIDLYGEMHRFIPALCHYFGAKITEEEVNHRPRIYGKSKYNLTRTFKVIFDLLMVKFFSSYITKPIYLFGFFSIILFILSIILFLITLYNKWYNHIFVKDQPLFLVGIFMSLVSIQLILIGIIAELLTRIYMENKFDYVIEETTYER